MDRARLVFMGTPDLAATCLARLLEAAHVDILAVVSQPDRPRGRHLRLQPTPVKQLAIRAGVPVQQPLKASDPDLLYSLRQLQPDLIVVAAYGQILPAALLDIPRHGCLNVHTSLLPRYRGAAPIQWALINGDPETGVTLMKIVPELDAGDVVSQVKTPITEEDDARTLHDRLAGLGADLLLGTIPAYVAGKIRPVPQPAEGVVYARKISKDDGRLDWSRPAVALWNQVRGLVPWPGTFARMPLPGGSTRLKVWKAVPTEDGGDPGVLLRAGKDVLMVGCGIGSLKLLEVQPEGKRRMTVAEFLAGHPMQPGDRLLPG